MRKLIAAALLAVTLTACGGKATPGLTKAQAIEQATKACHDGDYDACDYLTALDEANRPTPDTFIAECLRDGGTATYEAADHVVCHLPDGTTRGIHQEDLFGRP